MIDLKNYFDRIFVLTLPRTPQRLASFRARIAACDWPFREVETYFGVDGRLAPPPPWWHSGNAAHGCARSHIGCIEKCLCEQAKNVLILEDDAEPVEQFGAKAAAFIEAIPADAQLVYWGGQLNHYKQQVETINDRVIRPESVNRMHAYQLSKSGLQKAYRHFNRWNWQLGTRGPNGGWKDSHHCDHHLERLSREHQIVTYCPKEWLVNQAASYSEIMGRHLPRRPFTKKQEPPKVIAVVGPYCGGTSAVAGALHQLGILMGHKFIQGDTGHTPKGNFEAAPLFNLCNACFPEPTFSGGCDSKGRVKLLHRWAMGRWGDGAVIGAKHPKFCLMLPDLVTAWPDCKLVVVHRPIEKSIDSLRKRGWWSQAIAPEELIRRLVETRDRDLEQVPAENVCHIDYDTLMDHPRPHLELLAQFAGIEPTPEHYVKAVAQLDSQLNHHVS